MEARNGNQATEEVAKGCTGCQLTQNNPKTASLHAWERPACPWQHICIDSAGPFIETMFLIVVGADFKWPKMILMTTTSTDRTIKEMRKLLVTYGLPE